jgi:hypothetical protein
MQVEGRVGVQTLQDGTQQPPRLGKSGEIVGGDAHGHFYEANYRAGLFIASTPVAGVAPGTAFATSQGAFALYNPTGNTKNACIKKSSFVFLSGTLGAGIFCYGSSAQAAAPTGTAIVAKSGQMGNGATPTCSAFSNLTAYTTAATLVKAIWSVGALVTSALIFPPLIDLVDDEIILTPGNLLIMQEIGAAGTTPLGLFSMTWEEVPV